jgi:ubiquinone/menaquinone biosynthesis C-methylase UbiE
MTKVIGAHHDFHNADYVRDWANHFVPTPPRQHLFDIIVQSLLLHTLPEPHVVELGLGPGYLALEILQRVPNITYEGVDFSRPMFAIAAERLETYRAQITYTRADLTTDEWDAAISRPPTAIVSTWTLHDLGSDACIQSVYRIAKQVLPSGGMFLNGDFVKPDGTTFDYEPGRITTERHLELLIEAGFQDAKCLAYLEKEVENPTSANNYAFFGAIA